MAPERSKLKTLKRNAKLAHVPLESMRVREEITQRKFDPNWANQIAQEFNIEDFGVPTVSKSETKEGVVYWIVDGQHRIAALKLWLGDWEGQKIQCWVYEGLGEKDEAELFDRLNTVRAVSAFDKYMVRITARREAETNIDAIVRLKGLMVSRNKNDEGSISCPGTLGKVYRRGPDCLSRALSLAHDAFGDAGLEADILDGFGMLIGRYDGNIEDKQAVKSLTNLRGGVNALRSRAERLRHQMGAPRSHCVAAATVEAYNRHLKVGPRSSKRLVGWWKA